MSVKKHGISIGFERSDNPDKHELFMSLKVIGKLTHKDYEIITPLLESALQGVKEPKIKALIDATEFLGWEARAAWDDFKIGLKHGNEFGKIAVVGHKKWLDVAVKVGDWFLAADVKYFEEENRAIDWLTS